jgi:hypothetical protein
VAIYKTQALKPSYIGSLTQITPRT